ncbi:hypothetical protein ACOSP7_028575 [Xanthoceras sorbifolium]
MEAEEIARICEKLSLSDDDGPVMKLRFGAWMKAGETIYDRDRVGRSGKEGSTDSKEETVFGKAGEEAGSNMGGIDIPISVPAVEAATTTGNSRAEVHDAPKVALFVPIEASQFAKVPGNISDSMGSLL